jgi:hypothetical protein
MNYTYKVGDEITEITRDWINQGILPQCHDRFDVISNGGLVDDENIRLVDKVKISKNGKVGTIKRYLSNGSIAEVELEEGDEREVSLNDLDMIENVPDELEKARDCLRSNKYEGD